MKQKSGEKLYFMCMQMNIDNIFFFPWLLWGCEVGGVILGADASFHFCHNMT